MPSLTRESPLSETSALPDKPRTYRAMVWRQFRRNWIAVGGLALIAALFAVAIAAPVIANNKPILMRWHGRLSSPMLREVFAPSEEVPEQFLERVFNYALVLTVASLVILVPLWLAVRRKAWRAAALGWTGAALAVACLVPFFHRAEPAGQNRLPRPGGADQAGDAGLADPAAGAVRAVRAVAE